MSSDPPRTSTSPDETTSNEGTEKELASKPSSQVVEKIDEPPVVARLVVEIRSDGTRTVARGAMEDLETGQRVGVQAEGASPAQLALSLAKSLMERPLFASTLSRTRTVGRAVAALLPRTRSARGNPDD